jgi:hypothetical protein
MVICARKDRRGRLAGGLFPLLGLTLRDPQRSGALSWPNSSVGDVFILQWPAFSEFRAVRSTRVHVNVIDCVRNLSTMMRFVV